METAAKTAEHVETAETAETANKRNTGPMTIEFVDSKSETSTRVPADVASIQVIEKATEKFTTFDLSELPDAVIKQLAAAGAKKLIETLCRNNADETGTNIIDSAMQMFATLKAGKLYTRDGSGKGEKVKADKFDYDFYVDVVKLYTKRRTNADATPEAINAFRTKLSSVTPAERKEMLKGFHKNPAFDAAFHSVKAARANASAKTADTAELDLF